MSKQRSHINLKDQNNKWAYIPAKGNGDYYKTPKKATMKKRLGDIPPGCIFVHKVRVQERIDDELDHYKYYYEDGTVWGAGCWGSFDFITLVGQSVELTENAPVNLKQLLEPKVL